MRSKVVICLVLSMLVIEGCLANPVASPSLQNPPATTSAPELAPTLEAATATVGVIPDTTAVPTPTPLLGLTRSPLKAQPRACPEQAHRPYQSLGSSHLLVAASKGEVQGLFELSLTDGAARLVIKEPEWIAKVAVSEDQTWLVYSTLCEPGVTCDASARPDDPSHWVVADLSGNIYSRTAWAQSTDAYAWRLLGGTPEAVRILAGVDHNEVIDSLSEASQINLPSGIEQPIFFGFAAAITGTKLILGYFAVSPDLKREAHYAYDPGRREGSIHVSGLPGAVSDEWSILDSGKAGFAGHGYRMAWSFDGKFLAATLANALTGKNGEVYLLDPGTRQSVQVTDLGNQYATYFAAPTTWSPGGDRLALRVDWDQGNDTFVADFRAGRLNET